MGADGEDCLEPADEGEFEIGTCDGCGVPIKLPVENLCDVNYCGDCSPVTEDYNPAEEDDELLSLADENGIEID